MKESGDAIVRNVTDHINHPLEHPALFVILGLGIVLLTWQHLRAKRRNNRDDTRR